MTKTGGTILMLGPCNFGDEELIRTIKGFGYEMFDFELPREGSKPGFIKRYFDVGRAA